MNSFNFFESFRIYEPSVKRLYVLADPGCSSSFWASSKTSFSIVSGIHSCGPTSRSSKYNRFWISLNGRLVAGSNLLGNHPNLPRNHPNLLGNHSNLLGSYPHVLEDLYLHKYHLYHL